ncbi:hypothetical protein N7495_003176 [Penicillium taxi]|uniref:uncharacterized protein n=1 Tax=Penicillium taxi TaxID=168475 RepID=UPI002545B1C4|nr:uncharacterized protein N7495_003176 [Penicillium taxi]KAJ5902648.1 hypothetical protein N7495_003176 [Penicillium taxi]
MDTLKFVFAENVVNVKTKALIQDVLYEGRWKDSSGAPISSGNYNGSGSGFERSSSDSDVIHINGLGSVTGSGSGEESDSDSGGCGSDPGAYPSTETGTETESRSGSSDSCSEPHTFIESVELKTWHHGARGYQALLCSQIRTIVANMVLNSFQEVHDASRGLSLGRATTRS